MTQTAPTDRAKLLKSKRLFRLISLVLSLAWITPALSDQHQPTDADPLAEAGSDPRILPDLEQERLSALANAQLPDTETLWLESKHESFLGLMKLANQPKPVGAVILLHHDRTSADWPGAIATLRSGLPDLGWHTLSIALPDEPEYIPPRTDKLVLIDQPATPAQPGSGSMPTLADANSPATADNDKNPVVIPKPGGTEDPLQSHFEQISDRIEAGLVHLEALQPPLVLLLGEGSGAYWALRFSIDQQEGRRLMPVLVDALPPNTPTEPAMTELVGQLQQPALDLYHGDGLQKQRIERLAHQRKAAAQRQGKELLLSSRMSVRAGDWRQPDRRLLGVTRGMLKKLLATTPRGKLEAQRRQAEQQAPGN